MDEELEIQKNNCKSDGTWNEKKNTCECHGTDKIWNKEQAMCVDKTTKKTPLKDAFNRIKTNIQDNVAEKREEKAKQQVRKEKENKEKQQN